MAQVAKVLDGKAVAAKVRAEVAIRASAFMAAKGRPPGLAVVQVGANPASTVYVRNKRKACEETGIHSYAFDRPDTVTRSEMLALIRELNADARVDGILVQLPLPPALDAHEIMDAVDPAKDVDGFHPQNTGLLAQKRPRLRPCTPYGVIRLAKEYGIALRGLRATVVGASNIVGRPMALELLLAGSTVTVCHTGTRDLHAEVERAELVVAAVGKPGMVLGEWIREVRCRHQPHRIGTLGRRRRLRGRASAGRLDHAGPGRYRPDDDRDAIVQYPGCGHRRLKFSPPLEYTAVPNWQGLKVH
jgi:methylenetetrahydrofolate dehydrogenase (NADP+)/methenyltetrahydrofolate cyclohydrolase